MSTYLFKELFYLAHQGRNCFETKLMIFGRIKDSTKAADKQMAKNRAGFIFGVSVLVCCAVLTINDSVMSVLYGAGVCITAAFAFELADSYLQKRRDAADINWLSSLHNDVTPSPDTMYRRREAERKKGVYISRIVIAMSLMMGVAVIVTIKGFTVPPAYWYGMVALTVVVATWYKLATHKSVAVLTAIDKTTPRKSPSI